MDPPELPHLMSEIDLALAALPPSHGPGGLRGPPGLADQAVESTVDNDVSTGVDPSVPLVKGGGPDVSAINDANRFGEQAATAIVVTSLPASHGMASPPATTAAFADATASNSVEGGFITLDDTSAARPRLGNAPSPNMTFKGVEDTELDQGSWLADSPRNPADSASGNGKAARSENLATEVPSRPTRMTLPPDAEGEEGGGIELAISLPSPAGEDALPAAESSAGNTAQQLSDIRPDSGVGLFCDIEVSAAPTLPPVGQASAAVPGQNAPPVVFATAHRWNVASATKLLPPLTKGPQTTIAALADHLPLLLGVAVLVSWGGLRLEETASQRDRRLHCIADLRRSPEK